MFWLTVASLIQVALMVKVQDFKTCSQSAFCTRQQAFAKLVDEGYQAFWSVQKYDLGRIVTLDCMDSLGSKFSLKMTPFEQSFRLSVGINGAFDNTVDYAVENIFDVVSYKHEIINSSLILNIGLNKAVINIAPRSFKIEFWRNDVPVMVFNDKGYLYLESNKEIKDEFNMIKDKKNFNDLISNLNKNIGPESFGGNTDSSASIGMDLSFPDTKNVYGLPEHASNFSLKATRGVNAEYKEPYRLYNLDVFEFELNSPMALYGSIPFLLSHKLGASGGVFWLNAAEMWVDVEKSLTSEGVFSSLFRKKQGPSVSTHWMAESGILDLFVMLGDAPTDIFNSFTYLTGRPKLPQIFSLGYHQCRWNYIDENDVADVAANFDAFEIPYDVIWLDIEHTDGKRYFTWDDAKFSDPIQMQNNIASTGRKMVTIIDPHIKIDSGFPVYQEAKDLDLYVKNANGNTFEGYCWPGDSSWLDYLNPATREYWAKLFTFQNYVGSTENLYTWNDMNEPSVFSGPEITMPKDNIHVGGIEHRDIHNVYGMLQQRATYEGQLLRSNGTDRPFILSRAYFAGTQRYGAIWTGDNGADWDHLASSVPMLLSISISGVVFCGADVGGFFGNPDPELLLRWYQVGAFQPFFRAHAHIDSKRREPWLFGEPYTSLIRQAIINRYQLLPYIYTLFREASLKGNPVMRPMFVEFPTDENSFSIGDQFMLGPAILIKPVVEPSQKSVEVYLPNSRWYDYFSLQLLSVPNSRKFRKETPLNLIPVFLRGGTIIPRRQRLRRSASLMLKDPITLVVSLDESGEASGKLYLDDGKSFEYKNDNFVTTFFSFKNNTLTGSATKGTEEAQQEWGSRVERVIILGLDFHPTKEILAKTKYSNIIYKGEKSDVTMRVDCPYTVSEVGGNLYQVVIKDPKVRIGKGWTLSIEK